LFWLKHPRIAVLCVHIHITRYFAGKLFSRSRKQPTSICRMAAQRAPCIVWLVGALAHGVPAAVSLHAGSTAHATGDSAMPPAARTSAWACTSIAASSFAAQYDSYISGNTIVVTTNAGSQYGRAYYSWANSGGFRIYFDMY
ncbi:unnamed protein product, partial [Prorocentrum cordatum]